MQAFNAERAAIIGAEQSRAAAREAQEQKAQAKRQARQTGQKRPRLTPNLKQQQQSPHRHREVAEGVPNKGGTIKPARRSHVSGACSKAA